MGLNVLGYQSHQLQRYHPVNVNVNACGHEGSSQISLGSRIRLFIVMQALFNHWLEILLTHGSHAFRYGSQINNPDSVKRTELTTSALLVIRSHAFRCGSQINHPHSVKRTELTTSALLLVIRSHAFRCGSQINNPDSVKRTEPTTSALLTHVLTLFAAEARLIILIPSKEPNSRPPHY